MPKRTIFIATFGILLLAGAVGYGSIQYYDRKNAASHVDTARSGEETPPQEANEPGGKIASSNQSGVGEYLQNNSVLFVKHSVIPEMKFSLGNIRLSTINESQLMPIARRLLPDVTIETVSDAKQRLLQYTNQFPPPIPTNGSYYNPRLKDQGFSVVETVMTHIWQSKTSNQGPVKSFYDHFSNYLGGFADGGFNVAHEGAFYPFRIHIALPAEHDICVKNNIGMSFIDGFITTHADVYFIGAGCIVMKNFTVSSGIGQTWAKEIMYDIPSQSEIVAKMRDEQRLSDVNKIQTVLLLYDTDRLAYPIRVNPVDLCVVGLSSIIGDDYMKYLIENGHGSILVDFPCDPLPGGDSYLYQSSDGKDYRLDFTFETKEKMYGNASGIRKN